MINNTRKSVVAALGLGFALSSGYVASAPVLFTPVTSFEDDNLDYVIDIDGDGRVSIGDNLVAFFEVNATFDPNANVSVPIPGGELTGIVELTVTGGGFDPITGLVSPFTFGAMAGGLLDNNEVIKVFFDDGSGANVDFGLSCANFGACQTAATDGADYLTASLEAGDTWGAIAFPGGDVLANVQAGGSATPFALVSYDVTITDNPFGIPLLDNRLTGGGNILGGDGLTNGATGRSDFDFAINVVPEPGMLALLAVGLMGFGFAYNKKQV